MIKKEYLDKGNITENEKLEENNFKLDRENQLLVEGRLNLKKWLEDKKNEYYSSEEDNVIKNITLTQVLNKLKGDD